MNDEILAKVVGELHRADMEQRKRIMAIERYLILHAEAKHE